MPKRTAISNDHPRWRELADEIQAARVAEGYVKRAPFARAIGVDDSTLQIIEGTRPGNVSEEMLELVTARLGWERGAWRAVLDETAEAPSTDPIRTAPESVLLRELLRRANERERRAAG